MTTGPWRVELRAGVLWRVVNGTDVWGKNKIGGEVEANAVCKALNELAALGDARVGQSSHENPATPP